MRFLGLALGVIAFTLIIDGLKLLRILGGGIAGTLDGAYIIDTFSLMLFKTFQKVFSDAHIAPIKRDY